MKQRGYVFHAYAPSRYAKLLSPPGLDSGVGGTFRALPWYIALYTVVWYDGGYGTNHIHERTTPMTTAPATKAHRHAQQAASWAYAAAEALRATPANAAEAEAAAKRAEAHAHKAEEAATTPRARDHATEARAHASYARAAADAARRKAS